MPARLRIVKGHSSRHVRQIEKTSSSVGGSSPSDLVFPGLPKHTFTLEYREGEYWLVNTGKESLYTGDKVITPKQKSVWPAGQNVQIGNLMVLALESDRDPAPSPVKRSWFGFTNRKLLNRDVAAVQDKRQRLLTVIGCALAGAGLFLLASIVNPTNPKLEEARYFESVMQIIQGDTLLNSEIGERFRRARLAELQGRSDIAKSYLAKIREKLQKLVEADKSEDNPAPDDENLRKLFAYIVNKQA